jgi:hypothetical protein
MLKTLSFTSADWFRDTWLGSGLERENGLAGNRQRDNGRLSCDPAGRGGDAVRRHSGVSCARELFRSLDG